MSLVGAPDPVCLRLIGEFELRDPVRPVHVRPTAQRLLAYLAVAGRPVRRAALAEAVCGEQAGRGRASPGRDVRGRDDRGRADRDGGAVGRLRSALWRIPRPGGRPLITAGTTGVQLADTVTVDYQQTEQSPPPDYAGLVDDLLPDWDDEWLIVERERYRQVRLHALERLCVRHRQRGEYDLALRAGLTAVGSEPLRESAHRCVMEIHLAEGNPAEALRQYEIFRRLLRSDLGLSPSPAIRGLVREYLGRPADAG